MNVTQQFLQQLPQHPLVQQAAGFAIAAHAAIGQKRKYSGDPYHVHPLRVALRVAQVTDDPEVIAAALLHDVVEDVTPHTRITRDVIRQVFGANVAQYVSEVTDKSSPEDGNRAVRKAIDRAHLAAASPKGKTIKLADNLDNGDDIAHNDPNFAKVYMREIRETHQELKEGDPVLFAAVAAMLENYFRMAA